MNRRQLILTLGAGSTVVVGAATAGWAWRAIAARSSLPGVLDASHRAMLDVLSETLLPRTQTPGARDVGVAAWIEFVVSKSFRDADRRQFVQGLHAIDRFARDRHGDAVARLPAASVEQLVHALDAPGRVTAAQIRLQGIVARRVDAASALGQLTASVAEAPRAFLTVKELVLHGYFTSEIVQREVMRLQWA
jgi:hypothetical protein